jgi:hypothetical protein
MQHFLTGKLRRTMKSYCCLVTFVSLVLNVTVSCSQQAEFNSGANNLKIWNMFRLRGHKLAVSPLATMELPDEIQCVSSCIRSNDCYCVNTRKQANENVMCELLNRTMYRYPHNLTKDSSSSHWFLKVRNQYAMIWHLCIMFKPTIKACVFKAFVVQNHQSSFKIVKYSISLKPV